MVERVTVYYNQIQAAFDPGGSIYQNTRDVGNVNRELMLELCPIRTGEMLNSISDMHILPHGAYTHFYSISCDVEYIGYVLGGTKQVAPIMPHGDKLWMRPQPYSWLRFNTSPNTGGRWPFDSVDGQEANDFMSESLNRTLEIFGLR